MCIINVLETNYDKTIDIKTFDRTYNKNFNNVEEIYIELLKEYNDAEIIT
jgi:hypothetical protein